MFADHRVCVQDSHCKHMVVDFYLFIGSVLCLLVEGLFVVSGITTLGNVSHFYAFGS